MNARTKYAGYTGFDTNNPKTYELVFEVGKFIVNFGAVELLTYRLIALLDEGGNVHAAALDQFFMERFKVIESLVRQQNMPEEVLSNIEEIKKPIQDLAAFRNKIAHNPIILHWKGKDTKKAPEIVITDVKSQKGRDRPVADSISLQKLRLGVNAVDELARNLNSIISVVAAEMKSRKIGE